MQIGQRKRVGGGFATQRLAQKSDFITGVGGTIGNTTADFFRTGVGVAIGLASQGTNGLLDVTQEADWLAVVAKIEMRHGGLDGLFDTARVHPRGRRTFRAAKAWTNLPRAAMPSRL